ncbi:MAG: transposase, partial [Christensenellaceae bacterium]|nr:transposase [Christensenellaceae bacterium]
MYLNVTNRKNGTYLRIMESFYDSKTKKIKYANVRTIGYVDLYKDQYDDPLAYFRSEVERLNAEA